MFEEHQDIIDQAKWETDAKELLKRAADLLHDYCAEINGDMNDSLGSEIDRFLKN
jgi:hypothetical protein